MLKFLLDTDHLTLFEFGHLPIRTHIDKQARDAVGLGIVTVEEALRGRLAAIGKARDGVGRTARYGKLLGTLKMLQLFSIVEFNQSAEDQFQQLRSLRLRIGTQDLKIAAIALASNLILVTRNKQDFGLIPHLIIEDWSM